MRRLEVVVDIPAPAAVVWRRLTDWGSQGDWILATTVRPVGPQRRGPGDRIEAFTGIGRVGFTDRMVVQEWREGARVLVRHVGAVVRGSGEFAVEQVGPAGSRVRWVEDLEIPGGRVGQWLWTAFEPVNRWAVTRSLQRLAAVVQGVPDQSAPGPG